MKRFLALLCVAMLLINAAAAEGTFTLPRDLKIIREEAFCLSSEENGVGTGHNASEVIIIPEGTTTVGERAFANQPANRIELPRSLTDIADNAFDGCGNVTLYVWQDSYAHRWCTEHHVPYTVRDAAEPDVSYSVYSVETDIDDAGNDVFRCSVTTIDACFLRVDVLDNAGKNVISSVVTGVGADESCLIVEVTPSDVLPEYYVLRAVLEDADGNALCAPRTSNRSTSAYAEFSRRTHEDFPEETVLDFGESGFAALAAGVIPLNVSAVVSGDSYTFATAQQLKAGDRVLLNVDGNAVPVKIASLKDHGDGTVTVSGDKNTALSELYDFVSIDGNMVGAAAAFSALPEMTPMLTVDQTISLGDVELDLQVEMGANVCVQYDKKLWGEDYFDVEIMMSAEVHLDVFAGSEVDTWKTNTSPSLDLYNGVVILPGVHAPAFLNVSVPLNIKAKTGGNLGYDFIQLCGFKYNPTDGWVSVSEKIYEDTSATIGGELTVSSGIEVSLTASLLGVFNTRLGGLLGFEAVGTDYVFSSEEDEILDSSPDDFHACLGCVDIDVYGVFNIRGTLTYRITEEIAGSLLDISISLVKLKICDAYFSYLSLPDGYFGGETAFGIGKCPNRKYRARIITCDVNGKELTGLPVIVTGENIDDYSGKSPYSVYLHTGSYNASATIDGCEVNKDFYMSDTTQGIALIAKESTIDGIVSDITTSEPIAGAGVELTLPDGTVRSTVADENGCYSFKTLPGGTFGITASAPGYKSFTNDEITFSAGTANSLNISLAVNMDSDEIIMRRILNYMGEEMVQQMKDNSITLTGDFYYYVPNDGVEGDPIMLYELDMRTADDSCWPTLTFDIDLFRKAQAALYNCGAFELSEADIATLMEHLYTKGVASDYVDLDCGVNMHMGESPLYEAIVFLRHNNYWTAPEGYYRLWYSCWRYDYMFDDNKTE